MSVSKVARLLRKSISLFVVTELFTSMDEREGAAPLKGWVVV